MAPADKEEVNEDKNELDRTNKSKTDDGLEDEVKLSPEEEAVRCIFYQLVVYHPTDRTFQKAALEESQSIKADATALFTQNDFHNAASRYEDALLPLPRRAFFPRAVLHSNIAACHIKLEEWKKATTSATAALDALTALEAEDPALAGNESKTSKSRDDDNTDEEEAEEEIVSVGAEKSGPAVPRDGSSDTIKADILRIRTKSLLRRARAFSKQDAWSSLSSAESDYQALSKLPPHALTPADARTVRTQLQILPPKVKAAQEREVGEMWGKMKDLGNGLLKPFGLSTDNFQMIKDEKTGGYSMNFNQGAGSGE